MLTTDVSNKLRLAWLVRLAGPGPLVAATHYRNEITPQSSPWQGIALIKGCEVSKQRGMGSNAEQPIARVSLK